MPYDGINTDNLASNELAIPEGYYASAAAYTVTQGYSPKDQYGNPTLWVNIQAGQSFLQTKEWGVYYVAMAQERGILPITITGRVQSFTVTIEVTCLLAQEHYEEWQIKTFNALTGAYEARLSEYNNALADAKVQMGIEIQGMNPGMYRLMEQTELKKGCLRQLNACVDKTSNAMRDAFYPADGYPDFDCCAAINDGKYVQFVESCFEWQLMTYNFYPYFYSRRSRWKAIYQLADNDPIFQQFLQAGYARVVVPVRPGYEAAALRFSADGTIWNGGTVPGINDPNYVDLITEMQKPVVEEVGEPWELRVPTMLTILQKDASGIDETGLPCNPDGIGS